MKISVSEKIKIVMEREGVSITQLAGLIGCSRQRLSRRLSANDLTVNDLIEIAGALGYDLITDFKKIDNSAE